MSSVEKKVTYFKEAGKQNADVLLRLVREYVEKET